MMMSVASISVMLRWTVTGTWLASFRGPVSSPTISTRNGGGSKVTSPNFAIIVNAFITSKMPLSVETTASGIATRLTCSGFDPIVAWRGMQCPLARRRRE